MSLQTRLASLITQLGADVKALQNRTQVIVRESSSDPIPGGTPVGTVVITKS